ncbi:hypothetical protein PGQ11_002848 [Apiospora arundinis]|uniref:Uncharacterized protein n=1 Tax=Apiospora arundinis TaxID=335852 RepID=A0ABR2J3E0_9PEZI
MSVVVTRNLHVGLKLVNGAPFTAVDVVPDPVYASIAVTSDALHWQSSYNRTGPLCTPAFAVTDQKSQGKQFAEVLLNLKGAPRGTATAPRPSFTSLYVQLSRATRWEGLYLFQEPERSDFIEPRNVLDSAMKNAAARLERQGDETRERFWREHGQESWFAACATEL